MKLLLCGLATGFLWNAVGASAAFIPVDSIISVGSAEGPTGVQARSAEAPVERGSYLVNSIAAWGNCHARGPMEGTSIRV
jgi:hypothetical protein